MDQALNIARIFSIDAIVARNTLQIAYWSYRNYKADLLPGMVLDGTLPSLDKSLSSYQKEDGTYSFVTNRLLSENLNLSITQNIPYTEVLFLYSHNCNVLTSWTEIVIQVI